MDEPIQLDALGAGGPYRSRSRLPVRELGGRPVAELSLVPRLYVQRTMAALHRARTMPADERSSALTRAGRLFETGVVGGLGAEEYRHIVSRVSGMPITVVRSAASGIAHRAGEAYRTTRYARPEGAVDDWRDPLTRSGQAVWTRRGDVFAVHAAGNHPGVHTLWLEALAMGYRVAVRPSRREPFTPHRLISALRESGFGEDQVALLPTDYSVADDMIRDADLAMVYGGEEVVNKYGDDVRVLPQGPGRSKILLTEDDWERHLGTIVESVSAFGGTACVNTTAVFVRGDPAPVAAAVAERLAAIPSLPPEDDAAVLPVQPVADARAVEKYLLDHVDGATPLLGGDGIVHDLGDGSGVLRPAVFLVDRPDAPQTGIELSFPCVWFAPWSPADGVGPLRNTLVLTAMTRDDDLVDRLVDDPSIRNVYLGDAPTFWMPQWVPHDAYLGEFLMRTKGVIRA
ncbi:aldehyde dehydrogenase family protein [Microbispora triticiradicis]|uniref:aldehyde dehydrogenase family protein n=1 Tax=Microbispora triticiradicis TaxID=2200763 RepID=UPI001AD76397|nr:aldehyde dehydrogenase family protein [Microbispora triticiradicis]MBO4270850.1 aldehyde dehydrogenase family protein [Microbispora triticiradicis]